MVLQTSSIWYTGFFTSTYCGLTSTSLVKSQNSSFCCHSLFRFLRSDYNGEIQILLLCKPRKHLVGHAYKVGIGFYNHQQHWKSSTTQKKKKSNSCAWYKSKCSMCLLETYIWPWQQITFFQSYNPPKYIDFELKISSVEMKCCVLIV